MSWKGTGWRRGKESDRHRATTSASFPLESRLVKKCTGLLFLEGFLSAAARSLKKNFIPLGFSYFTIWECMWLIFVLLYTGISHGLNWELRIQVWNCAVPEEQLWRCLWGAMHSLLTGAAPQVGLCPRASQPCCSWGCEKCCCSKRKMRVVATNGRVKHAACKGLCQRCQGEVIVLCL